MSRRAWIWTAVAAALVVVLLAAGWGATSWARQLGSLAREGKDEARAGAHELAAKDTTAAIGRFEAASVKFDKAAAMLGPDWVGATVGPVPWVGAQYSAVRAMVSVGLEGSRAGADGARLMQAAAAPAKATKDTTSMGVALARMRPYLDATLAGLASVAHDLSGIDDSALLPQIASQVSSLKSTLASAAPFLDKAGDMLALERFLLSKPRRILVVSQDGAELRPTGGFVGSFGIIEVGPQGVALKGYKDVYSLPVTRGLASPPGAIFYRGLQFRDANWYLDFPRSAQVMLGRWEAAGQQPVDAIVAIDTVAIERVLSVLGPIKLPGYAQTFSSTGLLDQILYYTHGAGKLPRGGKDVGMKRVLVDLAPELERRVLNAGSETLVKIGQAVLKATQEKHVQVYFVDPSVQAAVKSLGWSGGMDPPAGTTDMLAVSNAVNVPSKANVLMRKAVDYRVGLQPDGSAATTLTLTYANVISKDIPTSSDFGDWLRVYGLAGSVFAPGSGKSYNADESGLPTAFRMFTVPKGKTRVETVLKTVPKALDTADGRRSYRLFVVRQADIEEWPTTVVVAAPSGWRIVQASATLAASGATLPVTSRGRTATLKQPLRGDVVMDVVVVRE